VASLDDHVRVVAAPLAMLCGFAESVTVGTDGCPSLLPPPPPQADNKRIAATATMPAEPRVVLRPDV